MGKAHLELYEEAVVVPGPTVDAVSEAARRRGVVVALGVNERDHGTLYNAQLLFDADGTLVQRRRKITPTYHERMVWGQGQGDGLRAVDTAVGRVGRSPAGSTTTRWPATRSWPTTRRSTSGCSPARWSGRSSPTRSR